MILLSACTVRLSVQRDGGKCSFLKSTKNRSALHRQREMSLEVVVETRLILPEDFHVLFLGQGDPVTRWVCG